MKRVVIAALALALALSACADPRVNVLVLWHPFTGNRERALLTLVDQWNQSNGGGSVVVAERRDASHMRLAMLDGKARGAEPALTIASPSIAALLQRNGLARFLDDYIGLAGGEGGFSAEDRSDLFEFVFRAGRTPDGKTIGMGFGGAARGLYFNRDWLRSEGLDAAPRDMDRLATVCGRASDPLKGTQCLISAADSATYQDWLYMFGGRLVDVGAALFSPLFVSQTSITATARLATFANAGLLRRALNAQQPRDEFAAGRSLLSLDWTDQLADYRTAVKENANFEWAITSPPATGAINQVAYTGWVWTITPGTEEREIAAWRFVRWLLDEPQTAQWASRTRELPVRASAFARLKARDGLDSVTADALVRLARLAQPAPAVSGWGCADAALADAMAEILDGRSSAGTLQRAQSVALAQVNQYCAPRGVP